MCSSTTRLQPAAAYEVPESILSAMQMMRKFKDPFGGGRARYAGQSAPFRMRMACATVLVLTVLCQSGFIATQALKASVAHGCLLMPQRLALHRELYK